MRMVLALLLLAAAVGAQAHAAAGLPRRALLQGTTGALQPAVSPSKPVEKMGIWIPFYVGLDQEIEYRTLVDAVEGSECLKDSFKAAVMTGPNSGPPPPEQADEYRAYFEMPADTQEWTTFGYITTRYGKAPLDAVLAQIDTWLATSEDGSTFGDIVQGVWVDQVVGTFTDADKKYYSAIIDRVKNTYRKLVALNPGRDIDACDIAGQADFVNAFESTYAVWSDGRPHTCTCKDVTRCIASVHGYDGAGAADDLTAVTTEARARGYQAVFITERRQPEQYSALPAFWKTELQALCATAINA